MQKSSITQQILRQRRKKTSKTKYIVFCCFIIVVYFLWEPVIKYLNQDARYDKIIEEASKRHCMDSRLIKAVIWRESKFDRHARGQHKEIGLMQITMGAVTDWAKEHNRPMPSKGLLFHPELNIEIGTWYLAKMLRLSSVYKYRAMEIALCQYNAGRKKAFGWEGWPPKKDIKDIVPIIQIESTKQYTIDIMNKYFENCQ